VRVAVLTQRARCGSRGWPALGAVKDPQDQDDGLLDPVDHDVWRSDDHELACGGNATGTSDRGMIGQPFHSGMDGISDADRCPRITLCNPLELRGQIAGGLGEPLDPHAGRPVDCRSMAARCCCQLERTDS
jgi:hypothetical protein